MNYIFVFYFCFIFILIINVLHIKHKVLDSELFLDHMQWELETIKKTYHLLLVEKLYLIVPKRLSDLFEKYFVNRLFADSEQMENVDCIDLICLKIDKKFFTYVL